MSFVFVILIIVVVVSIGYYFSITHEARQEKALIKASSKDMEKIVFTVPYDSTRTIDIVSHYYHGGTDKGIILLHMMPATKESWNTFAEKLHTEGYHVLAIDSRGHGESIVVKSTKGSEESIDYKDFTDAEHTLKERDIEGAYSFLLEQGVHRESVVVAGASIGANLTLVFMENHKEIAQGILLSPGSDYKGVRTDIALKNLTDSQRIDVSASKGDTYSAESVSTLEKLRPDHVTATLFEGNDHGTDIFKAHPNFMDELINWLS